MTIESRPASLPPQLLEPDARPRARVEHVIADALVHAESLTRRIGADQVGLVRDEDRRDLVVLGNDQEAVDQPRIRWRPVAGEHDGDEVRVGDDDVLAPRAARTGLPAAEAVGARLDGDDRPGAIGKALELDGSPMTARSDDCRSRFTRPRILASIRSPSSVTTV